MKKATAKTKPRLTPKPPQKPASKAASALPPKRTRAQEEQMLAWGKQWLAIPRTVVQCQDGQGPLTLHGAEPDQERWMAEMGKLFGTVDPGVMVMLAGQLIDAVWKGEGRQEQMLNAQVSALAGIAPRDQVEGLLAVQMIATHNLAMEMIRRALLAEQTIDGVNMGVTRATKLLRLFTAQTEALARYRGGGKQTMVVEHVHVEKGGQAVVGQVQQAGRQEGGKR